MQSIKYLLIISVCLYFFSCNDGHSKSYLKDYTSSADNNAKSADSATLEKEGSSSAAVDNPKDNEHKFIRTADLRFKVANVASATYKIEDIIAKEDGFVTYTNLSSTINNTVSVPVSADSTLETTYYTVSNDITIRVPNTNLDTTLKQIAQYVDFLDSRVIKADDVSLELLSNKLKIKRLAKGSSRITTDISANKAKLYDVVDAENGILDKQEEADNSAISNLSLSDRIKFSTITLSVYQRQSTRNELVANDKNINAYKPAFGSQLLSSLHDGWEMLEVFFVFIARFWTLILFSIAVWFLYKALTRRSKTKQ